MSSKIRNIFHDFAAGVTILTGAIYFWPGIASLGTAIISLLYFSPKINTFGTVLIVIISIIIFIILSAYFEKKRKKSLVVISDFIVRFALSHQSNNVESLMRDTISYCEELKQTLVKINKRKKYEVSIHVPVEVKGTMHFLTLATSKVGRKNINEKTWEDKVTELINNLENGIRPNYGDYLYKSALSIPINERTNNHFNVLGILSIEGLRIKSFDKYDIKILEGTAKLLIPLMKILLKELRNKSSREQGVNVHSG